MFGTIFDFTVEWIVIFLIGVVIKLMDDYLDQDLDKIEGKYTLAMFLDKAILPYTLLCTVMCIALKPALGGSLFIGSYIVGMGHDLRRPLPFGWTALREFVLFGLFGVLTFGLKEMASSFLIVLFIQLADDFIDYYSDVQYSRRNFIIYYGFWETVIAGVIAFLAAVFLDPSKAICATISAPIIMQVMGYGKGLIKHE